MGVGSPILSDPPLPLLEGVASPLNLPGPGPTVPPGYGF